MNEVPVDRNLFTVIKRDGLHYFSFVEIYIYIINIVIISDHTLSKLDEKYTK